MDHGDIAKTVLYSNPLIVTGSHRTSSICSSSRAIFLPFELGVVHWARTHAMGISHREISSHIFGMIFRTEPLFSGRPKRHPTQCLTFLAFYLSSVHLKFHQARIPDVPLSLRFSKCSSLIDVSHEHFMKSTMAGMFLCTSSRWWRLSMCDVNPILPWLQ